jgi:hypothetical protein
MHGKKLKITGAGEPFTLMLRHNKKIKRVYIYLDRQNEIRLEKVEVVEGTNRSEARYRGGGSSGDDVHRYYNYPGELSEEGKVVLTVRDKPESKTVPFSLRAIPLKDPMGPEQEEETIEVEAFEPGDEVEAPAGAAGDLEVEEVDEGDEAADGRAEDLP